MRLWNGIIAAGYGSGQIRLYEAATGSLRAEVNAHARWIYALDLAPATGKVQPRGHGAGWGLLCALCSPRCAHGLSAVPLQLLSGAEDSFVHVWKLSRNLDTDDVEVRHKQAVGILGVTAGCHCPVGTTARCCGVTSPATRGQSAELLHGNLAVPSLSCCSDSSPPPVGTIPVGHRRGAVPGL